MLDSAVIKAYPSNPRCGEIWMCQLSGKDGSIQTGYRPVYVLSNDRNNTFSPTLNVIPLTSKMNKRNLPIHVELLNYECYGLRKPSTLMIEQITTVVASQLDIKIGEIRDVDTLNRIYRALEIQFPILAMFAN